jgi:hypothetical protein
MGQDQRESPVNDMVWFVTVIWIVVETKVSMLQLATMPTMPDYNIK